MAPIKKYHPLLRALHWLIAFIIFLLIAEGFYMISPLSAGPFNYKLYLFHRKTGFTLFLLILMRLCVRLATKTPPPVGVQITKTIAKFSHTLLYILPIMLIISGYVILSSTGKTLPWIFNINIPMLIDINPELAKQARAIHYYIVWSLIALIGLHILGAFKYVKSKKSNIFLRIL